jgi:hypothetical protein
MSTARRAKKTLDKTRRGDLPVPSEHTQLVGNGDGRPCDGCGETILPSETACTVSVQRALDWRFHEDCYEAWVSFRAPLDAGPESHGPSADEVD